MADEQPPSSGAGGNKVEMRTMARLLRTKASDERVLVLGYFQRLNQAGYDHKGQVSAAAGQAGVGFLASANWDFGAMVLPFIHIRVGARLGAGHATDALVVIERHPSMLFDHLVSRPPQPPIGRRPGQAPVVPPKPTWASQRPLSLSVLRGRTWDGTAGVELEAWGGLARPFGDESGLGAGVDVTGGVESRATHIEDVAPRHYPPSAYASTLTTDVDALFEDRLEQRALAWIVENGGRSDLARALGVQLSAANRQRLADVTDVTTFLEGAGVRALDTWGVTAVPQVEFGSVVIEGVRRLIALARGLYSRAVRRRMPSVDELVDALATAKLEFVGLKNELERLSDDELFAGADRSELAFAREGAMARIAEAEELIKALRHGENEPAADDDARHSGATLFDQGRPQQILDIGTLTKSFDAEIAAAARITNLPVRLSDRGFTASASYSYRNQRTSFRWESRTPGVNEFGGPEVLITTRDTVISYHRSRPTHRVGAAGGGRPLPTWGSMGYRCVTANRLGRAEEWTTLNGSGVSLGASVLHSRLVPLAGECYAWIDPHADDEASSSEPPRFSDEAGELEDYLTGELKVSRRHLRRFLAGFDYHYGDLATTEKEREAALGGDGTVTHDPSVLIEAGFVFTTPLSLKFTDSRLDDLFTLQAVADRLATTDPTAPSASRLQVLRARYRIEDGLDLSRDLFSLGFNPRLFGETDESDDDDDELQRYFGLDFLTRERGEVSNVVSEFTGGFRRRRTARMEGIIDLHTLHFPDPFSPRPPPEGYGPDAAAQHARMAEHYLAEISVAPVTLFNY